MDVYLSREALKKLPEFITKDVTCTKKNNNVKGKEHNKQKELIWLFIIPNILFHSLSNYQKKKKSSKMFQMQIEAGCIRYFEVTKAMAAI